jgi:hypothetical protein
MRGPQGTPVGILKRVILSNIVSSGAGIIPSILSGVPGHNIEDIKINDVYFEQIGTGSAALAALEPPLKENAYPEPNMFGDLPASGIFIRHVRNLEVSNMEIATAQADARPAFWLADVDGADFFRVRVPGGAPAFDLRRVKNFRSFGSRSVADVSLDNVETKKI